MTNFIVVFNKGQKSIGENARALKTSISAVYVFSTITLLPMFFGLSCDYLRLYQYISVCTFTTILLFDKERIERMFPKFYIRKIESVNNKLTQALPPTKGLLLILLLFYSINPSGFSLGGAVKASIFGLYDTLLYDILRLLVKNLIF